MKSTVLTLLRVLTTIGIAAVACWMSGVALERRSLLLVPAFVGLALALWANKLNPEGGKVGPAPLPANAVKSGPYRIVSHPMYVGQACAVVFFMWYAAGFWAAFALGLITEVMFREYIWREEGSPAPKPNPAVGRTAESTTASPRATPLDCAQ
jgi:protein-S-isoprenylcysteine O-methyltransferase Ste14